jgi:hypothetical protein
VDCRLIAYVALARHRRIASILANPNIEARGPALDGHSDWALFEVAAGTGS